MNYYHIQKNTLLEPRAVLQMPVATQISVMQLAEQYESIHPSRPSCVTPSIRYETPLDTSRNQHNRFRDTDRGREI